MTDAKPVEPSREHGHPDELDEDQHPHGPAPAKFATGAESDDTHPDDFVEETSRDSFPASDPPAY